MHLPELPHDVLTHVFSYVSAHDHLAVQAVCRQLRALYANDCVWQRLAFQYFPHESRMREQHLALDHHHQPIPEIDTEESQPSRSVYGAPTWRDMFQNCTHTLQGLLDGCFARTHVWEHHIPGSSLLVDYQVFDLAGTSMFMERSVSYSGVTRFLFRSLSENSFHFEWKINMREIFPAFNPLSNRTHCDIRVKNSLLMLAFYSTNGTLSRLYSWPVSTLEDLRQIPTLQLGRFWTPRALFPLEGGVVGEGGEVENGPAEDDGKQAPIRLMRLQPPFAALQSTDFLVVNVLTNEVVFHEPNTNNGVQTCRWDSGRLVYLYKPAHKRQQIHIVKIPQLAVGFKSRVDRFSHPHSHNHTSATSTIENHSNATLQGSGAVDGNSGFGSRGNGKNGNGGFERIVVPCRHKLSGGYLDFFHTSDGLAIFASTVTRTFCKICVGTHCKDPLHCPKHPLQQSLFVIEKEAPNPPQAESQNSTTTNTNELAFTMPKGLLFGNCGPFIAFSDGCDVYWFVDRGPTTQPVARKVRVGMGQRCTGHHQVVILGSSLVHICSKHSEQVREVSLYEPCTIARQNNSRTLGPRRFPLQNAQCCEHDQSYAAV